MSQSSDDLRLSEMITSLLVSLLVLFFGKEIANRYIGVV